MNPGKIIQNYQVSHLLGSGGMGEVWAGTHLYMDRKVAVKSLHARLATNPEIRKRFKQEAYTMSQLNHPNIVRLYDFIEEEDGVYLVMEFVDGDPLDEYILRKSGPIPEPQALEMFAEILGGMHYAHMQGVIHRDIKPGNFMVTKSGRMKILDFGIAKLLEGAEAQHTKTGARIGTVLYMSPEQVQGQALDLRSDVYSLGVTLFQMVTGQGPYRSDATEYEIYQQILNQPLPRANSLYPAVSERMQALIDKATAKRPEARFQDCRLFLDAIQFPDAVPLVAAPTHLAQPSVGQPAGRPKRMPRARRILVWTLVLAFLGGLAAVGYLYVWPMILNRDPKVVAYKFLSAMEDGDLDKAKIHATETCSKVLEVYLAGPYKPKHRKANVGRLVENGPEKAFVNYQFVGDTTIKYLVMEKLHGQWKVSCSKESLYEAHSMPLE